jgi:hypothetical protein
MNAQVDRAGIRRKRLTDEKNETKELTPNGQEIARSASNALLSDIPAMLERCRSLASKGCYCCEVWPVEDEGPCERCLALKKAADVIAGLASMIEHTADGHPVRSGDTLPCPWCRSGPR